MIDVVKIRGEKWIPIEGFELYEVSNFGRVKSNSRKIVINGHKVQRREHIKLPSVRGGYENIHLFIKPRSKTMSVHRLVAKYFIPNPDNKLYVNHKDGNKRNNRVSNLEWVTHQENIDHSMRTGLFTAKGENHYCSKLKRDDILFIRKTCRKKYTPLELSKMFNVSRRLIYDVALKNTYADV